MATMEIKTEVPEVDDHHTLNALARLQIRDAKEERTRLSKNLKESRSELDWQVSQGYRAMRQLKDKCQLEDTLMAKRKEVEATKLQLEQMGQRYQETSELHQKLKTEIAQRNKQAPKRTFVKTLVSAKYYNKKLTAQVQTLEEDFREAMRKRKLERCQGTLKTVSSQKEDDVKKRVLITNLLPPLWPKPEVRKKKDGGSVVHVE